MSVRIRAHLRCAGGWSSLSLSLSLSRHNGVLYVYLPFTLFCTILHEPGNDLPKALSLLPDPETSFVLTMISVKKQIMFKPSLV